MDRVKVTLEKKIEIKTLLNTDLSQRQVAKFVRVSQKCVLTVSNKLKQDLPLSNATGQRSKKGNELNRRSSSFANYEKRSNKIQSNVGS